MSDEQRKYGENSRFRRAVYCIFSSAMSAVSFALNDDYGATMRHAVIVDAYVDIMVFAASRPML